MTGPVAETPAPTVISVREVGEILANDQHFRGRLFDDTEVLAEESFAEATFEDCAFTDLKLTGGRFEAARFKACRFHRVRFADTAMKDARFVECSFYDPEGRTGVAFAFCDLRSAIFERCAGCSRGR